MEKLLPVALRARRARRRTGGAHRGAGRRWRATRTAGWAGMLPGRALPVAPGPRCGPGRPS